MSHESWHPGWPDCDRDAIVGDFAVDGVSFAGGIRWELCDLVTMLVRECAQHGYPLVPGWCWGYACRAVTGSSSTPSNHSYGTAVDLNAPANPYGPELVTDMPAWMPDLWAAYDWRWGGDYGGNKDAMHYEFMGSRDDAYALTERARADGLGGGEAMSGARMMASTPSGNGYWICDSRGGVFTYGDAQFYGAAADVNLAAPIVAIEARPNGDGYWLLGADGGIFTYGAAPFHGAPVGHVQ